MNELSSPHITKKGHTTRRIMLDVLLALIPSFAAAVYFFGRLVFVNLAFCVGFCFLLEKTYEVITKQKIRHDLSAAVTGVILALNLPSRIEIWGFPFWLDNAIACFLASFVAIVLVKMLFGGIGKNFANPAAVGRIFLFLAFALPAVSVSNRIPSAATGATPLAITAENFGEFSLKNLFLGPIGSAAAGETCVPAILAGYIYLCFRRVIDWKLPLLVVGFSAIFFLLFKSNEISLLASVLSGGLIFGAVFMATDYSTSPNTFLGSVVFALGIGLFAALIRRFAAAPEGFSFALVIMNILVPTIDKYIANRPFGLRAKKRQNHEN